MVLTNKIIKSLSWGGAAKGIALILYICMNGYLARELGIEQYGNWTYFFSIFSIIHFISFLGLDASARIFAARYNNTDKLRNVIKSSLPLIFYSTLFFGAATTLSSKMLARLLNKPEFSSLFFVAGLLIITLGFVEFLKSLFIGLHRIKYNFILNAIEHGLKLGTVVFFMLFSNSLSAVVAAFCFATFVTTIAGFYLLYRYFLASLPSRDKVSFKKDLIKSSLPLMIADIGQLVMPPLNVAMLGLLSTESEVGIYGAVSVVLSKMPHLTAVIVIGTMPLFAKMNRDNFNQLMRIYHRILSLNIIMLSIIAVFFMIMAGNILSIIFGPQLADATDVFRILTLYFCCFSVIMLQQSFLNYRGLAKKNLINQYVAIVLNVVLNIILIPEYGAIGAAIAALVSIVPHIVLSRRLVKCEFRKLQAVFARPLLTNETKEQLPLR